MSGIRKNIQKNIAKFRKREGLTQKELAVKLGIAPTNVASWEQGKSSPDIDTLIRICEILNTNLVEMYECKFEFYFNELGDHEEAKILHFFRELNEDGKEKALEYIEDLASMSKYKKSNQSQMVDKNA